VLVKTHCTDIILARLKAQYGKALEDLMIKFDGTTRIVDIMNALPYDKDAIWFLINKLVEVGCLTTAQND
jgi:hypothetical protein